MTAAAPRSLAVAIAGGSGSGKTTLARAVAAAWRDRCAVIDHDSYYRDLGHLDPAARAAVNFDHPDALDNELLRQHLGRLQRGLAVDRPVYCFATHTRQLVTQRVEPRQIVLVEGILLLAVPELRRAFDLRVFVDVPADVRALRRVCRDVGERGRTPESVLRQWTATVRPMHEQFVEPARAAADLVISGEAALHHSVAAVTALVEKRLASTTTPGPLVDAFGAP